MENNLPSREDYIAQKVLEIQMSNCEWSEPLYACPECGTAVRRLLTIQLASMPPQYIYRCYECGYEEYHI